MKKKKLFSSLAVTSMIINPMASSVFANSSDISSSINTEIESAITTEVDDSTESNDSTESSNAGSLSRCTPDINAGSLSRCTPDINAGSLSRCTPDTNNGVIGNGELNLPTQCDNKVTKKGPIQHTVKEAKDKTTKQVNGFMAYDCDRTHDEYIVRVNRVGDSSRGYKYGDGGNNYTFNNFKVEYKISTVDKYKNLPTSSAPGCHNIRGEKQIDFTVTTQDGATLGNFPGMVLDEKTEFNDAKQTVQYKFHCVANGGGQQYIDINLFPIEETISTEDDLKAETVSTVSALESALKDENLEKVIVNGQITVDKELTVSRNGVTIVGENNGCIDFHKNGSLVLKGSNINISNLTVKNASKAGIQLYKASDAKLDNVRVEDSANYGILVNASTVTLNNCSTSNNKSGGMMVCRATNILAKHGGKDSKVIVTGSLNQKESAIKVMVKNSQMIDVDKNNNKAIYRMQNNEFNISNLKNKEDYKNISKTQNHKTFNDFYKDNNVKNALKGISTKEYEASSFNEEIVKYKM